MDTVPENILLEIQGDTKILFAKGVALPTKSKTFEFRMPTKISESVEFILHMTSDKYLIDSCNYETLIGSFILSDIPKDGERIIYLTVSMNEDLWITFTAVVDNIKASITFNSRKEKLSKKQRFIQDHFESLQIDFSN